MKLFIFSLVIASTMCGLIIFLTELARGSIGYGPFN